MQRAPNSSRKEKPRNRRTPAQVILPQAKVLLRTCFLLAWFLKEQTQSRQLVRIGIAQRAKRQTLPVEPLVETVLVSNLPIKGASRELGNQQPKGTGGKGGSKFTWQVRCGGQGCRPTDFGQPGPTGNHHCAKEKSEVATGVCKELAQILTTLQLGVGENRGASERIAPTNPKDRSRSTSRSKPRRAKGNKQTDGMKAAINRSCVLGQQLEQLQATQQAAVPGTPANKADRSTDKK
eukprot:5315947-Amphidinium_carterae.2